MAFQRLCSEESESRCQRLETSVNILVEEKEDLAMVITKGSLESCILRLHSTVSIASFMSAFFSLQQLTDALLEMEEEKAIWLAREKATVEAINEKAKSYSAEIANVSRKMTEVTFRFTHDVVEQFKHILVALQWLFLILRISSKTQCLHNVFCGVL